MPRKYWIAVISKEHALRAAEGGFIQVNHGKEAPLKKLSKGDEVMIYSPKTAMYSGEKLQCFTAWGEVEDDEIYRFRMTETFMPFRKKIKFHDCAEMPILPLIHDLQFIPDKKSWGYPFRFGFFEINAHDYQLISTHLKK